MTEDLRNFDLREGDLLAGKFRVERLLGSGGMGVVVEATHVTLKDRVALKFLRSPKFADQTTITRFLREAQAAARIKSPHVARVLDVGTLDDGSPYMVMEFLEGTDLGTILDREGMLPVDDAVKYALQTCEALAAAHARNVVHRDVKPSNLFLTHGPDREPLIKVLDFGISKMLDGTTSGSITETQRAVGSPSYMAPEQMRSAKRVDGRADIWSLGVVVYELLSGKAPFVADTIPELYALILDKSSRPAPLSAHRAELPEGLERITERCLEKDAAARYGDVAELAEALAPFGGEFGPPSAARTRRILEAAGLTGGAGLRSAASSGSGSPSGSGSGSPSGSGSGSPSGSRPDVEAPISPGPHVRTATSFAETQPPAARPRRVFAASLAALAAAVVALAIVWMRQPSDVPRATGPAAAAAAPAQGKSTADPVQPPATVAAPMPSTFPPLTSAMPIAPSASAPRRPAPIPITSSPRTARPKPSDGPLSDDVLLHRK